MAVFDEDLQKRRTLVRRLKNRERDLRMETTRAGKELSLLVGHRVAIVEKANATLNIQPRIRGQVEDEERRLRRLVAEGSAVSCSLGKSMYRSWPIWRSRRAAIERCLFEASM